MFSSIRERLKKNGIFYSLKYSLPGRIYLKIFKKEEELQYQKELNFYISFLPDCKLVFDIGANDGHKTAVFLNLSKKVIACDPDPQNIKILSARFRNKKNVDIEAVAISNYIGSGILYIEYPGSALNSINPEWKDILETQNNGRWETSIQFSDKAIPVITTTLDELIKKYGEPDYIKIDVEGNEINVLKGLTLPFKFLSYEVLLPEFLNDAISCMDMLSVIKPTTVFNYAVEEKLKLPQFVDSENFKKILYNLSIPHLEIIAAASIKLT